MSDEELRGSLWVANRIGIDKRWITCKGLLAGKGSLRVKVGKGSFGVN